MRKRVLEQVLRALRIISKRQYHYDSRTKAEIRFEKKSTAEKPLRIIAN